MDLIKKYNHQNTILVISSYPDKKDGIKNLNAVAWYAKKTLKNFPRDDGLKLVVLAEVLNKPEIYQDGPILVVRCWKRNSPLLFKDIIGWIKRFSQAKTVLVEFEFSMFGGLLTTVGLPVFLTRLKLLRKRVVLELHQVILDVNLLSGHLNLKKGSFLSAVFNFALKLFYTVTGLLSNKIIVLEEEFKRRLSYFVNPQKIRVIPIAVSPKKRVSQQKARKKLGIDQNEFVLLYFGFITWYKGVDWLVKKIKNNKKIKLIIAGGESPTLRDRVHYRKFYQKILCLANQFPNIQITGFVEEQDIPLYFAACDLVVLPYRVFMSSSGPLSWTLSYKKPFVMSNALAGYFQSESFKKALEQTGIQKQELLFSLNSPSFLDKLERLRLNKHKSFTKILAEKRSIKSLSKIYLEELINERTFSHSYRFGFIFDKLYARHLAYRLGQSPSGV